jgi:hypothetical protein
MRLPTQRLTITPTEYRLIKPGLEVLVNGLTAAKFGLFPHRHPYHNIDLIASAIYASPSRSISGKDCRNILQRCGSRVAPSRSVYGRYPNHSQF